MPTLSPRRLRSRLPIVCCSALIVCTFLLFILGIRPIHIQNTISYGTRPLWDKPNFPTTYLPHYYADGIETSKLCSLHGWEPRDTNATEESKPRVYDAIIFSIELDLLEIRLRELYDVVEKFLILESATTFTGKPKALVFHENRERFRFAEDKIQYKRFDGRQLQPGEDPFHIERETRMAMNDLISQSGIRSGTDWILMTDVDEIPSFHTLQLFQSCTNIPTPLHLQMRNYMYSYEFYIDKSLWQAQIHKYEGPETYYRHGKSTDLVLSDSGWHCSFCFRYLADFVFKAKAYSHTDRLQGSEKELLDPSRIQKVICEGSDFFGMLPEAYSWKEFVAKVGNLPKDGSAVGLPKYLVENADRFRFLLPGGCVRES